MIYKVFQDLTDLLTPNLVHQGGVTVIFLIIWTPFSLSPLCYHYNPKYLDILALYFSIYPKYSNILSPHHIYPKILNIHF